MRRFAVLLLLVVVVVAFANRPTLSRQECLDQGGVVVGDIGDGAIHRDDYRCAINGEPPVATILPAAGEPIAFEGEVCCGSSAVTSDGDEASAAVKQRFVFGAWILLGVLMILF